MRIGPLEAGTATKIQVSGKTVLTTAPAAIIGILFCGTGTGQVQLFANTGTATMTADVTLTPVISFSATTSAVAGGFSPMFMRYPAEIAAGQSAIATASGSAPTITNGLIVDAGQTLDPNLIIFWSPSIRTP